MPMAQPTCDDGAINAIPVSDHVAESPVSPSSTSLETCFESREWIDGGVGGAADRAGVSDDPVEQS